PHPRPLAEIEGRLPPEIVEKAESDGIAKASQDAVTLLSLGVLGGASIAYGAIFATITLTGVKRVIPLASRELSLVCSFRRPEHCTHRGRSDLHWRRADGHGLGKWALGSRARSALWGTRRTIL